MAKKIVEENKEVESTNKSVSTLDIAKKTIMRQYGDVVKPMSEKPLIIDTISTRSIGLDAALGRGGFAKGRIYEIIGDTGSGKTTLAISLIAEAQSRGMNCVFVDAEHSADSILFENTGVDLSKLTTVDLYTGEDNLSVTEMLMATGEIDLVVIDSVTALIPKVAADASLDDNTIALLARLMSKTLLRFVPIAAETGTCVVFINQTRNKIGGYGDPRVSTGGDALPYYSTGRIRVSGAGTKANRIADDKGVIIGHKTTFEILKNKLAAPFTVASADLYYGVGYDCVGEIIKIATDLGILTRGGSWYSYSGRNIGQGEQGVRRFFDENPDVFMVIKKEATDILGLTPFYEAQKAYDDVRSSKTV